MAEVKVTIDQAAVADMFTVDSPGNPVAQMLRDATQIVEDTARIIAPVSPEGSKFAPPGFLKSRIRAADTLKHDSSGRLMGLVGTNTNRHGGGYPYPLAFIANDAGSTWNRGRRSKRPAVQYFLRDALNSLAGFRWGRP